MRAGSILKGAAPDGTDIGADFTTVSAKVAGVVAGIMSDQTPQTTTPVAPAAEFTVSCTLSGLHVRRWLDRRQPADCHALVDVW